MEIPNIKINILDDPAKAGDFWRWLTDRQCGYVAFDTETGAAGQGGKGSELDWRGKGFHVRMAQFGDTKEGWAIPYNQWRGMIAGALEWCSQNRIRLIGHNLFVFDRLALRTEGVEIDQTILEDTQVYAGLGGFAEDSRQLKPLAVRNFGKWAGVGQAVLKTGMDNAGWTWTTVPMNWRPYPLYGVVDTIVTAMLWEKWIDIRKKFQVHHDMEIAVSTVTNDMSWNGVTVDGQHIADQIEIHHKMEEELLAEAKSHGWNMNSNEARKVLLEMNLLDTNRKSELTGVVSMDAKQLSLIDHPLPRLILKYRNTQLIRTRYLEDLMRRGQGELGHFRVYPSIWSMEARTGRMSVSAPPLQQMPSGTKVVRAAFVPDEDDHVLISSDYSQVELRVWAFLNKDAKLLEILNEADRTGENFFVLLGRSLFGPSFQKSDPRYTTIKSAVYATMYSGGDTTIAETVGLPLQTVHPIVLALKRAYPSFMDQGISMTKAGPNGSFEIITPTGRTFRVANRDGRRKLPNYATQGHSAEILKGALLGCKAAGLGPYMKLAVHDELLFSVPRSMAKDAMMEIAEIMDSQCDENLYGVRIYAKPAAGSTWAELK